MNLSRKKNRKQDRIDIGPLEYIRAQQSLIYCLKANALTNYFSSVYTSEDTTNVPVLKGNPLPDIPPIHIHADGVAQLLLIISI